MKYLLILSMILFSCTNNVSPKERRGQVCEEYQEKVFLGYDLDKVHNRAINIKVHVNNNDEMDAFMVSLKAFDVVEMARMEGFAEGEMFVNVIANGNYPETLRKIRRLSNVFYAEPDYKVEMIDIYEPSPFKAITSPFGLLEGDFEDDPQGDFKEYSLEITEALRAYSELKFGENSVWVGILDSGTNGNHEDLKYENGERVVKILKTAFGGAGAQITDVPSWNSDNEGVGGGHGTHCTGSICAVGNNGKGIAGVAWKNVKLASYKVLKDGSGYAWSIYDSLKHFVDTVRGEVSEQEQATIPVNMSLGGHTISTFAVEALNYALSKGVLPIVANGNEGQFLPFYPAACPGVLSVGASGTDDKRAVFSNVGSWLNVVAPGQDIISLQHSNERGYLYMSGTSMAAPFVTGMIAYLLSFNPKLTPYQIIAILEKTADKIDEHNQHPLAKYNENGFSNWYGYGRVNVYRAAKMVKDGNFPPPGEDYVETVLTIKGSSDKLVYVYEKKTGVLVTMSIIPFDIPSKVEIRGLRPGEYNVVCDGHVKEAIIGNDQNITLTFY